MRIRNLNDFAAVAPDIVQLNNLFFAIPFFVFREGVDDNEVVSKGYVDLIAPPQISDFKTGTVSMTRLPAFTGELRREQSSLTVDLNLPSVVQINATYSSVVVGDHGFVLSGGLLNESDIPVFPWSQITTGKPTSAAGYGITDVLMKTGGTMTGPINVEPSGVFDETLDLHAIRKGTVDAVFSGGGSNASPYEVGYLRKLPSQLTPPGYLKTNGAGVLKLLYPELYAIIGDRYTPREPKGFGLPWHQQYNINLQQTTPLGDWVDTDSIPRQMERYKPVVTRTKVYLLAGNQQGYPTADIFSAEIYADGRISEFSYDGVLPDILADMEMIVCNDRVYLFGGSISWSTTLDVYVADIKPNGNIENWRIQGSIPPEVSNGRAVLIKDKLHVITNEVPSRLMSTTVAADGTFGSWTFGDSLPDKYGAFCIALVKDKVYLLGGFLSQGSQSNSPTFSATVSEQGMIGMWTQEANLPDEFWNSEIYVTRQRVYLIGSVSIYDPNLNINVSKQYSAPINADGTLGTWTQGPDLPPWRGLRSSFATHSHFYVVGGNSWNSQFRSVATPIVDGLSDYSTHYGARELYKGPFRGFGQPWLIQTGFSPNQNTEISSWQVLPTRVELTNKRFLAVTSGWLYLFEDGGDFDSVVDDFVASSAISKVQILSDGTLGPLSDAGSFAGHLAAVSVVAASNRIYLLGCPYRAPSASFDVHEDVYSVSILPNGLLGTWEFVNKHTETRNAKAAVIGNRIYLFGGLGGQSDVQVARIRTDGSLGGWVTDSGGSMPKRYWDSQIAVTKKRVYMISGTVEEYSGSEVSSAAIYDNGTLGKWELHPSLPDLTFRFSQAFVTDQRVYLLGGEVSDLVGNNLTSADGRMILSAPIYENGSIGAWSQGSLLPFPPGPVGAFATQDKLYVIADRTVITDPNTPWINYAVTEVCVASVSSGLNDYSPYYGPVPQGNATLVPGFGKPWQHQHGINTTQSTAITNWAISSTLLSTVTHSHVVMTKNKVFVLGGLINGVSSRSVFVASLDDSGNIGSWSETVSLPRAIRSSQVFVAKNKVHIVGSEWTMDDQNFNGNVCYSAPIDDQGNLGTWSQNTPPTYGLERSQSVVINNHVYLIGGVYSDSPSGLVITAEIDDNGTFSNWRETASLPDSTYEACAIGTNSRIYVLGGFATGNNPAPVYSATFDENGELDDWVTETSLPEPLKLSHSFVTTDRVYLIGGIFENSLSSTVLTAPINANGALGMWTTSAPLPERISGGQLFVSKNKIHLVGGVITTVNNEAFEVSLDSNRVYTATILGGTDNYYPPNTAPTNNSDSFTLPTITWGNTLGLFTYIKF